MDEVRRPVLELYRRTEPLRENMSIAEAARRIADAGSGLPVADATGKLVGYVGEHVLLKAIIPGYLRELHDTDFFTRDLSALRRRVVAAAESRVAEHMETPSAYVEVDDSEMHAAELFLHRQTSSIPVVGADGEVLGVLRLSDLTADLMHGGPHEPVESAP